LDAALPEFDVESGEPGQAEILRDQRACGRDDPEKGQAGEERQRFESWQKNSYSPGLCEK
jgi:hypothetical protein